MTDEVSKDAESDEHGTKVIPFPVKFTPSQDDDAPQMRSADELHDGRCRHRRTVFDKKARVVTCQDCKVPVDVFEVLESVVAWIRNNEWRYDEMRRSQRIDSLAKAVRLLRVKQGRNCLLIGNTYVTGYHVRQNAIPTEAIALGDYVSSNRLYRARRENGVWAVMFYDPAHGLKAIKHADRLTLAQAKAAICKHWLWLNNNAKAAGLA